VTRAHLELARGDLVESRIADGEIPDDEVGDALRSHNLVVDRMRETLEELRTANTRIQEASNDVRDHKEKLRDNYLVVEAIKDDLEEKNRRLRQVDRLRSEFLANMAHELRTPINAITGFTELTIKTQRGLTERGRSNLEKVIRSGHELLKMIQDILDLSRLEAGKLSVQTEEFNLGEMIDECIASMEPLLGAKDVRLDVELDGDFRRIRQDRAKLRQMVLNLVGNAAKFTEKGRIRIVVDAIPSDRLSWRPEAPDPWFLRVTVEDTGIGIAPEHLDRVFEQFAQVGESAGGKYGGTGLGLYIVQQFARLLGGEAFVESRPREGSRFSVTVPIVSARVEGPRQADVHGSSAPG
jgi:signal transduction histidine kinase